MLGASNDYDYDAARRAGVQQDYRGHWPDTFKLPNHITFSDQSMYHGQHGAQGGQWAPLPGGNDSWMFSPGATNLRNFTPQQLQQYFQQYEPNSLLRMPNMGIVGGGPPSPMLGFH